MRELLPVCNPYDIILLHLEGEKELLFYFERENASTFSERRIIITFSRQASEARIFLKRSWNEPSFEE